MKTDLDTIRDSFRVGFDTFEPSRAEAKKVIDYFHNRQFTPDQLAILSNRGQPAETFNIIKVFTRMLQGYYATVINTVNVDPVQYQDIATSSLLNDLIGNIFRLNNMNTEGDKIKVEGILAGLMVAFVDVHDTDAVDSFGRPIRDITIEMVPSAEVILDPMSRKDDYSDARFIHRFKWLTPDQIRKTFGKAAEDKLVAYYNHLEIDAAEFATTYNEEFQGRYKVFNNYLVVHTVIIDDNDKRWNIYWAGDVELSREEITHKEVVFPYRVQKIHSSDKAEYYGAFRELISVQDAVNQAIIKIQLMVNSQKVVVEKGSIDDLDEFEDAYNRVSAIIEVKSLAGIKFENMSKEIQDQYILIDKAFDRVQRLLGINDSFLGQAFASDSGRKVKIQQNSSIMSLRYLTGRFEQFYKMLGWDIVNLIKQYYTANQVVRIVDETTGERWIEINKPIMEPSGQVDSRGRMGEQPVMVEKLSQETGEPEEDKHGNILVEPVPTEESDIAFTNVDISITASAFNDEDEKSQLMLETILSGNMGQLLSQVNPAGYFKAAELAVKTMKSKHSPDIAAIFAQTAQMLSPEQQQAMQQGALEGQSGGGSPKSQSLKLPQNTNEGA